MNLDLDTLIFDTRFKGLRTEVEKELYKNAIRKIVKIKLEEGTYYAKELQDVYTEAKTLTQQSVSEQYFFITICPYDYIELEKIQKAVTKFLKKKWMQKYLYVYEQREDDPDKPYNGIHLHFIVHRTGIAKSDVIREIYNTCKNIVGSKQSVDVKLLKTERDLYIKINYLLGAKSSKEKMLKQLVDRKFRQEKNLLSYYSIGEWDDIITKASIKDLSKSMEELSK